MDEQYLCIFGHPFSWVKGSSTKESALQQQFSQKTISERTCNKKCKWRTVIVFKKCWVDPSQSCLPFGISMLLLAFTKLWFSNIENQVHAHHFFFFFLIYLVSCKCSLASQFQSFHLLHYLLQNALWCPINVHNASIPTCKSSRCQFLLQSGHSPILRCWKNW